MFTSEITLDVRYYETDLMGIVHHSNYIRYFECGRNQALIDLGMPMTKVEEMGIMMPVIKVSCEYKLPARHGDKLRVVSTVKEMPRAKITIDTVIQNTDNQVVCTGSVTLGFIHSGSRRPTRAPEFLTTLFQQYFEK